MIKKIKEEMATNAGGVGEYSTPKVFKKYRIKEIKVNPPVRKARITSGDENEIIVYKDKVKYQNNPQEIEKALQQQGVRDIFDDDLNNTYWALIRFIGDEGEVLPEEYWWDQNEINYNINELNENHLPEPKDFPIKVSDYYQGQMIGGWLQKHGYKVNLNDLPFDINPVEKPYYIYDNGDKTIDWSEQLNEIKVNEPKFNPNWEPFLDNPFIEQYLFDLGYDAGFNKSPYYIIKNDMDEKDKKELYKRLKSKPIYESKYSQFKQSTTKPNPKQVLHKAIKEIQLKLDEVNKLIDFTSRIKGELTEGDQEIEYLKRTKDNINKIQNRLKEVFNKLCELDEIKVNNPTVTYDEVVSIFKSIPLRAEGFSDILNKWYNKYPHANFMDTIAELKPGELSQLNNELKKLKSLGEIKVNNPNKEIFTPTGEKGFIKLKSSYQDNKDKIDKDLEGQGYEEDHSSVMWYLLKLNDGTEEWWDENELLGYNAKL